jgi:excisionase family DNA binding protein
MHRLKGSTTSPAALLLPEVVEAPPFNSPADERLAYPVDAAAEIIGVSRATLYNLMRAGQLPFVQVRGKRLLRRSALAELLVALETRTKTGAAA